MVTNSTNINKTNNHLLILTELAEQKNTTTYEIGNTGPGLGRAQKCGGVKQVNGIPTLPFCSFKSFISRCGYSLISDQY
jgi:hypothetical protein